MQKPKILFVAPNLRHGGAEAVLVKLINNMDFDKFDAKLALVSKDGGHLSKITDKVEIIDLGSSRTLYAIPNLIKTIKKERPDFVFSIISHINLIGAMLKTFFFRDIHFIGRENLVHSEWLYKDKNAKKIFLDVLYKIFLKKLDTVVVQSNFMAAEVQKFFNVSPDRIAIITNPIETEKVRGLASEEGTIDWKPEKRNLVAVGRIEQVKNFFDMVDILELLPADYHLNILGDGKQRDELAAYIAGKNLEDRVTLHGFVTNPYKYIKRSEMLLLTSTRESSPNVVLEANACDVYVVSYDMPGGIREMVQEGVNGSLIPVGDKQAFANEIISKSEMSNEIGRIERYSNKFSIHHFMERVYQVFA